jgi:lysine 2,3-aminomutase
VKAFSNWDFKIRAKHKLNILNKMKELANFNPETIIRQKGLSDEVINNILNEGLLTPGILRRLHLSYPQHSGILNTRHLFNDKEKYIGLNGFKEIVEILNRNGIQIDKLEDREMFIAVYRFMATKHVLNAINWDKYEKDSLFQLVFPQPGMIKADEVAKYKAAKSEQERAKVIEDYMEKTNPHDGKQQLNKPWFVNDDEEVEVLKGVQHKYPQCQLILDKSTQNCFAFCNYCFRHAQVRGDEDMFLQEDIQQIHRYLRKHKEVTDVLITGGDAGYLTYERLEEYALPLINDDELMHIKTLRLGTRVLSFQPEYILSDKFKKFLDLFKMLKNNGLQVLLMSHFSTPHELLNPSTIAAINRLRAHNVTLKSQSPIMRHISLFANENGEVDVERSAQNWIDLGNILAMLGVGFHSMYFARPTGEHHYFTTPLADIEKVFTRVYRDLPSINRPSRFITMTSSAGKISLLGVTTIKGEKVFVLKVNEGRNMDWIDRVYLAKYDEKENTIAHLKPYEGEKHFYEDELVEIENSLEEALKKAMGK